MYTLTKADVLLVAEELATLDDPRWAQAIALATSVVSSCDAWGGDAKAKFAATYLAAHLAKLELVATKAKPGVLAGGPISEVHAGPVGRTYTSLATLIGDKTALYASLALTTYGLTFAGLRRAFSFGRFVVT